MITYTFDERESTLYCTLEVESWGKNRGYKNRMLIDRKMSDFLNNLGVVAKRLEDIDERISLTMDIKNISYGSIKLLFTLKREEFE